MKFVRLTEEQRCFFDENDYLIIREALDAPMLHQVIEIADHMVERHQLEAGGRRASEISYETLAS